MKGIIWLTDLHLKFLTLRLFTPITDESRTSFCYNATYGQRASAGQQLCGLQGLKQKTTDAVRQFFSQLCEACF